MVVLEIYLQTLLLEVHVDVLKVCDIRYQRIDSLCLDDHYSIYVMLSSYSTLSSVFGNPELLLSYSTTTLPNTLHHHTNNIPSFNPQINNQQSTININTGTRSGTRVPVAKNTVLMTEDAKEITEAKRDTNTGADRDHYNNSNSNGNVSGMHNERGNSGMSGMGIDVGHSDEYDLYGFVGVEGAGGSGGGSPRRNSPKRTGTGAVASRPSSAPLQRGSQGVDSRFQINYNQVSDSVSGVTVTGLTVEERLQQMMRGMGMAVAGSHIHDRDRDSYSQVPTSASAAPVSASARGGNNGNTSTSASSNRPSSARDRHAGPAESKTPSDFNNPNVVDMQVCLGIGLIEESGEIALYW